MNDIYLSMMQPVETEDLIRIGRNSDGGYLVNKSAIIDADLISFGINDDWSFEEHYLANSTSNIEMYDGSVSYDKFKHDSNNIFLDFFSLRFLYSCLRIPGFFRNTFNKYKRSKHLYRAFGNFIAQKRVTFHSKFVSDHDGKDFESIQSILKKNHEGKKLFFKIDIEGFEFRILNHISRNTNDITGMVIEFHDILYEKERFCSIIADLKKSFYISHIHANNYGEHDLTLDFPSVWELTFINKNLFQTIPNKRIGKFPIVGLDYPNTIYKEDFTFTF